MDRNLKATEIGTTGLLQRQLRHPPQPPQSPPVKLYTFDSEYHFGHSFNGESLAVRITRALLLTASLLSLAVSVAVLSLSLSSSSSGLTAFILLECLYLASQALVGLYVSVRKSVHVVLVFVVGCTFNAIVVGTVLSLGGATTVDARPATTEPSPRPTVPTQPDTTTDATTSTTPASNNEPESRCHAGATWRPPVGRPDGARLPNAAAGATSRASGQRSPTLVDVILWSTVGLDLLSALLACMLILFEGNQVQQADGSQSYSRPAPVPLARARHVKTPTTTPRASGAARRQSPQQLAAQQPQLSSGQKVVRTGPPAPPATAETHTLAGGVPSNFQFLLPDELQPKIVRETVVARQASRAMMQQQASKPIGSRQQVSVQRAQQQQIAANVWPYTYQPVHVVPNESAKMLDGLRRARWMAPANRVQAHKSTGSLDSIPRALTRTGSLKETSKMNVFN